MVRDRRKYAMITSPFMVFYGNLLIVLQYIWSFEELGAVPGLFLKKEVPFRELGSKVRLTATAKALTFTSPVYFIVCSVCS